MNKKTIKFLTGTVKFLGMWHPITLDTGEGTEVDISEIMYEFMGKHNGKPAKVVADRESFSLKIMDSDHVLNMVRDFEGGELKRFGISIEDAPEDYVNDKNGPQLLDPIYTGGSRSNWSNTLHEIETLFTSLVGRKAILELEDDTLTIRLDAFDDEDTKSVYYTHGNMANLPKNWTHEETCKPGTTDACIFLTMGQHGFACAKYSGPTARTLMDRHANGQLNAGRVGTCKCAGRWEGLLDIQKEESETA